MANSSDDHPSLPDGEERSKDETSELLEEARRRIEEIHSLQSQLEKKLEERYKSSGLSSDTAKELFKKNEAWLQQSPEYKKLKEGLVNPLKEIRIPGESKEKSEEKLKMLSGEKREEKNKEAKKKARLRGVNQKWIPI